MKLGLRIHCLYPESSSWRALPLLAFWLPSCTPRFVAEISFLHRIALPQLLLRGAGYQGGSVLWWYVLLWCGYINVSRDCFFSPQEMKRNKHLCDGETHFWRSYRENIIEKQRAICNKCRTLKFAYSIIVTSYNKGYLKFLLVSIFIFRTFILKIHFISSISVNGIPHSRPWG